MEGDKTKIEKLVGSENWSSWKFQVQILLNARNALEVTTGDDRDPGAPAADLAGAAQIAHEKKRANFKKANKIAKEIIATTVEKKPLQLLLTCDNAKAIWDKLLGVYEQKSETSVSMVQTQFYQYVKTSNDDMATHILKVESISKRLKWLGEPIPDSMIMTNILNTLPAAYNHFASAWDSTPKAGRTRDNLTSRLLTEELRKQSAACGKLSSSTVTLSTKAKFEKKPKVAHGGQHKKKCDAACYNCGERSHYSRVSKEVKRKETCCF